MGDSYILYKWSIFGEWYLLGEWWAVLLAPPWSLQTCHDTRTGPRSQWKSWNSSTNPLLHCLFLNDRLSICVTFLQVTAEIMKEIMFSLLSPVNSRSMHTYIYTYMGLNKFWSEETFFSVYSFPVIACEYNYEKCHKSHCTRLRANYDWLNGERNEIKTSKAFT